MARLTARGLCRLVPLAVVFNAAVSVVADPKVRNTVVVPLGLPSNYRPAALGKRAVDEKLRIGFLPPLFDRSTSATWTSAVHSEGGWRSENVTEVDQVILNFAEPVARALPGLLHVLFPNTEIVSDAGCRTCDLLVTVILQSFVFDDNRGYFAGVTLSATVSVFAADRSIVTTFVAKGTGEVTKSMYWSSGTRARAVGIPALQQIMEQIVSRLKSDPSLLAFLKARADERARPCDLATMVAFDDAVSFFPNGRLDAGEGAVLHLRVQNRGPGPAFAVHLRLEADPRAMMVPTEVVVGDVAAGSAKQIDIPLSASIDVDEAQQPLRVETLEKRGYNGRSVVLEISTARLRKPALELADIRLEDRTGRARGDGDGIPSNGETLEAVILVRNGGPADAAGAALTISATPDIEVVEPSLKVGAIPVNGVKEARTLLRIPIASNSRDLRVAVHVGETRGDVVATADGERRWPLELKKPAVDIGVQVFDGNSPQSQGNRDGVANNGETLELALVPSNRGTLAARGVRLKVTSLIRGVSVQPTSIPIGDLPPLAQGSEQRVQLVISRTLGSVDLPGRLPVTVTVTQADFPAAEQMIGPPFAVRYPQLVPTLIGRSPLSEGQSATFALVVSNQGHLDAEDVKVDLDSDNRAVELLESSGAPTRVLHWDLGRIAANSATETIHLRAVIRRNVAVVDAALNMRISQRDFPAVTSQTRLTIATEEPVLIAAPPLAVPDPLVPRAASVPATISFQRHRDNSRLVDEIISLSFEVQSQAPLETVRLEQNHRAIELSPSAPLRTAGTYLWQYEPQVHLEYGRNEFEVVVITSEGVRNSRSMTLHRERPQGKFWLAVVGISSYREPTISDLGFAKADAVAVHAYYRQLDLPNAQLIELLDEAATLANIKRTLGTELVKHATNPDDTVVIYFAGHGQMEADRSSADSDGYSKYLLPYDANPADLFGSALSMEELSRILQRLRPERVVLIIDSCFSGAAGGRTPYEPNAASRGVIAEEFLSRMASSGKGRVILTASGSREVAQESSETGHGIFTYFLLEGLRGAADIDHDGRIDVDEIYKFVSQKVSVATHGRQNPMRKSPNLTGTLILGGRLQ